MPGGECTDVLAGWEGYRVGSVRRFEAGERGRAAEVWIELKPVRDRVKYCSGCFGPVDSVHDVTDLVRSGEALRVRLQYRANRRIENPHFGIRIHTDMGVLVTDTSTWAHGVDTPLMEPGTGTVEFEVDTLNLMPGRYFLSFWIEALGPVHFDGLEHCLSLDVEGADCYGTGRGIDKPFGIVVMPCRWSVAHRADASVH